MRPQQQETSSSSTSLTKNPCRCCLGRKNSPLTGHEGKLPEECFENVNAEQCSCSPNRDSSSSNLQQQQQRDAFANTMLNNNNNKTATRRTSTTKSTAWTTVQNLPIILNTTSSSNSTKTNIHQPSNASQQEHLQRLQIYLQHESWNLLLELLRHDPSLSRLTLLMHCRGERMPCLPLHAAVARRKPCMDVMEALVTLHPAALQTPDVCRGRWPLHLALLKGAPLSVVRYLTTRCCCSSTSSTKTTIRALDHVDDQGQTPLHYACQYATEETCRFLLQQYPAACSMADHQGRLPLHLLCTRGWCDTTATTTTHVVKKNDKPFSAKTKSTRVVLSLQLLEDIRQAFPSAVSTPDHKGRWPLHRACTQQPPRPDVLQWLIQHDSSALLQKDNTLQRKTPLQCLVVQDGVVATYMRERTGKEKKGRSWPVSSYYGWRSWGRRKNTTTTTTAAAFLNRMTTTTTNNATTPLQQQQQDNDDTWNAKLYECYG